MENSSFKVNNEELDRNLNTLFKLVHVTSFNVSLQALMLLSQVADSRDDMLHRYFNALYRKMFDLEWRNTSKQTFFLNLLYNSVMKDDATPRIKVNDHKLLKYSFKRDNIFYFKGVCEAIASSELFTRYTLCLWLTHVDI